MLTDCFNIEGSVEGLGLGYGACAGTVCDSRGAVVGAWGGGSKQRGKGKDSGAVGNQVMGEASDCG